MAYPGEQQHVEYMNYLIEWASGEGKYADQPKMSKEEWIKKTKGSSSGRRSVMLSGSDAD